MKKTGGDIVFLHCPCVQFIEQTVLGKFWDQIYGIELGVN